MARDGITQIDEPAPASAPHPRSRLGSRVRPMFGHTRNGAHDDRRGRDRTRPRPQPPSLRARPGRAQLVLLTLILVAAVANLNLAVANVALPDIGAGVRRVADGAQPRGRRLLPRAGRVGALPRRRWATATAASCMLILGVVLSVPACLLAACAPSVEVLVVARLLGGAVGGHGVPDDAGADHRAVVGAGADEVDRAVVGARRGDRLPRPAASRATCSSTSGGARSS